MLIMPSTKTTKIVVDNGKKKEIKNPYSQPYTIVRKGDKGEFVKWVQWELKQAGYKIKVDGIFGKDTEKLLKKYQKEHALAADGICGANTIKCMLTD
jgi:peptidoglycan hydrolase-like protein with peptidoglycan-binding domain